MNCHTSIELYILQKCQIIFISLIHFICISESKPSDKPRLIADISKELEKANTFDIWGSVGGMHGVKRQITEAIFWPIMVCDIILYILKC